MDAGAVNLADAIEQNSSLEMLSLARACALSRSPSVDAHALL